MTPSHEPCASATEDSPTFLRPGYILEQFCVTEVTSRGNGLGPVYQGIDLRTGTQVAIDEFIPRGEACRASDGVNIIPTDPESPDRFHEMLEQYVEQRSWLQPLSHPHLASFRRVIRANGTAYKVNDWLSGQTLGSLLGHIPRPDETMLLHLLLPLMGALDHMHHHGVLHREIGPQAIFLDEEGMPVLPAFHVEREDAPDRGIVVLHGFSPLEQYSRGRDRHTPAADIYALSAVFIYALLGTAPPAAIDRLSAPTGRYAVPKASRTGCSKAFLTTLEAGFALHAKDRPQTVREWAKMLPPAG